MAIERVQNAHISPFAPALLTGVYAALVAVWPSTTGKFLLAAPLALVPLLWWILANATNWLALFMVAALLLPPLPFALGNTGPHPSLAVAALGLAIGGLRFGEWRVAMDSLSCRMLLFPAVLLGTVAMAAWYSGEEVAAGSLTRVGLFSISIFVFFYSAYGPGAGTYNALRATRLLFWIGVASALFACIDFYYQFPPPAGYGPQFIWLESGIFRRAQGVFYEASTLGNFCAFFLTMIAVALFQPSAKSPVSRPWMLAGGAVLAAALLLSFSRSSLANLAAAGCGLVYLHRERFPLRRLVVGALVSSAACALLTLVAFPSFAQLYWTRMFNSFTYFVESPNGILSGRLDSWSYLIGVLIQHPLYLALGVGYKTLPYSEFLGKIVIADNTYLSLLVETGVVGLSAMLALSLAILRASRQAALSENARRSFFGSWVFCFWCGEMVQMLSGDILTYWRVLPLYFWALAMAIREL